MFVNTILFFAFSHSSLTFFLVSSFLCNKYNLGQQPQMTCLQSQSPATTYPFKKGSLVTTITITWTNSDSALVLTTSSSTNYLPLKSRLFHGKVGERNPVTKKRGVSIPDFIWAKQFIIGKRNTKNLLQNYLNSLTFQNVFLATLISLDQGGKLAYRGTFSIWLSLTVRKQAILF